MPEQQVSISKSKNSKYFLKLIQIILNSSNLMYDKIVKIYSLCEALHKVFTFEKMFA